MKKRACQGHHYKQQPSHSLKYLKHQMRRKETAFIINVDHLKVTVTLLCFCIHKNDEMSLIFNILWTLLIKKTQQQTVDGIFF